MKIHIVKRGDTLWKIAKRYGVDFKTLLEANTHIKNPDKIMPGMKVKVPTEGVNIKPELPTSPHSNQPLGDIDINLEMNIEIPSVPFKKEKPMKEFPVVKEKPMKEAPVAKEMPIVEMPVEEAPAPIPIPAPTPPPLAPKKEMPIPAPAPAPVVEAPVQKAPLPSPPAVPCPPCPPQTVQPCPPPVKQMQVYIEESSSSYEMMQHMMPPLMPMMHPFPAPFMPMPQVPLPCKRPPFALAPMIHRPPCPMPLAPVIHRPLCPPLPMHMPMPVHQFPQMGAVMGDEETESSSYSPITTGPALPWEAGQAYPAMPYYHQPAGTWMSPGMAPGMPYGYPYGMTQDMYSGMSPDMSDGTAPSAPYGTPSDFSPGTSFDTADSSSGESSSSSPDTSYGMAPGTSYGAPYGMTPGMSYGTPYGTTPGMSYGTPYGMPPGMPYSSTPGAGQTMMSYNPYSPSQIMNPFPYQTSLRKISYEAPSLQKEITDEFTETGEIVEAHTEEN
ncbi:SafA/ExsA family spore coat assembly protein [Aneurinibacillus terranovensis]|uniref:SafA/ExsA family spore coat assembly protein n=1 Tax=Aneurinibacillus terranovensis TaxID=278991 RepID=UPI000688E54A|nr:SafA/ExsA family spore coat assembly protein [Aneurinibacillus terranovensis]